MLSTVASFVSSLTGKVALGTALAAASVGTAHAAHVADHPSPHRQPEAVVDADVALDAPPETTTTVVPDETTTTLTTVAPDDDIDAVDADTDTDGDAGAPAAETDDEATEPNHGQVVSEFAHTTELEGCERGQAIAQLASGGRAVGTPRLDRCAKTDEDGDANEEPVVTPAASTTLTKPGKGGGRDHG